MTAASAFGHRAPSEWKLVWAGEFNGRGAPKFPLFMRVDYVRVYQRRPSR